MQVLRRSHHLRHHLAIMIAEYSAVQLCDVVPSIYFHLPFSKLDLFFFSILAFLNYHTEELRNVTYVIQRKDTLFLKLCRDLLNLTMF